MNKRLPMAVVTLLVSIPLASGCSGNLPGHAQAQKWVTTVKQKVVDNCKGQGNATDELEIRVWNWDPNIDRPVTISTRSDPPKKDEKDQTLEGIDHKVLAKASGNAGFDMLDYQPDKYPDSVVHPHFTLAPGQRIQITVIDDKPANLPGGTWPVLDHVVFNNVCPKGGVTGGNTGDKSDCDPNLHADKGMQNPAVRHRCLKARGLPEDTFG